MLPAHTILFPTDFSTNAQQVYPLACSLARDCGARLVVLHVVAAPADRDPLLALGNLEETYPAAWQALRQLHAPDDGVHVEHCLEAGDVGRHILQTSERVKAGLIVMGTHGRTGVGRVLFGSVAERVLRGATCPVLTVKEGAEAPRIQTILCATDLSEASAPALGVAFSLARDYHARLVVVHVSSIGFAGVVPYDAFEKMLTETSSSRRVLEDKFRECRAPACHAEFRAVEGDAAEQIVRAACQERCDLIVMGTHGRTGIARLLTGSVAEKTLRDAPCPVLLVKHAASAGVGELAKSQPQMA